MGRSTGTVAAGRLSQRDIDILGIGLHRLYPVREAEGFDDLLAAIDEADRCRADQRGASRDVKDAPFSEAAIAMDGRRARA
jgi:hypothetical protein